MGLEAMELSMEHERLETMECQLSEAEGNLDDREVVAKRVAKEVEHLRKDYRKKLGLHETRFADKRKEPQKEVTALKSKLANVERRLQVSEKARAAAERRERVSREACAAAERHERASEKARAAARAELSCFHK